MANSNFDEDFEGATSARFTDWCVLPSQLAILPCPLHPADAQFIKFLRNYNYVEGHEDIILSVGRVS